jgi:ATP-dependent DNA ligase
MSLPLNKSYPPMEAMPASELPVGAQWQYEPKWDGFRCLAFRDGAKIALQSKSGKPLTRYFPELVAALGELRAERFVLDGEIVIPVEGNLSFDDLLMRIHPAASRIQKLSEATPAVYIVFDLLVQEDGRDWTGRPLRERRAALEKFIKRYSRSNPSIRLSPSTKNIDQAAGWFHRGVGLDGIVAKREDLGYQSGQRTGMQKIKKHRTADCVVGGFRYLEKKRLVGSLLLGLYNREGLLDHVGFSSSIRAEDRASLTKKLEKLQAAPGFTGKAPGGPSRWSTKHSMQWVALAPQLVVEVEFDHFTGGRFRHGTKLLRWRPDKKPKDCTIKQVRRESQSALALL